MAITKQLTTGPLGPVRFEANALSIEGLEDYEITVLLDTYLFGHSAWCDGGIEVREDRGRIVSACRVCGARDAYGRHVRVAPWYSIEQIARAILARNDQPCLHRFAIALYRQCYGVEGPRMLMPSLLGLVALLCSPRTVAIAALTALGVVDGRGYLTGGPR